MFDAVFPARMDLSCAQRELRLGGWVCDRGIGVHARSELSFALSGKPGRRFVALVGIDEATEGPGCAAASVLLDGKPAWSAEKLAKGGKAVHASVELGEARVLTLLADFGPDGEDAGDHVNWAWAAIVGP
jgi:hypothetical protein